MGSWGAKVSLPPAPCPLALHFLLLGGIFKVAHAYCPVSQGPADGRLKDTHEDMGGVAGGQAWYLDLAALLLQLL